MKLHDIRLVQDSFEKVAPIADTAADLFYGRLFELDPSLRGMFAHADMDRQKQVLMQMISHAVHSLDNLAHLVPVIRKLGQRHSIYGVEPSHYDTVGSALLWTLQQGLGDEFTPEVAHAWSTAYGVLAGAMQEGAQTQQPPSHQFAEAAA